MLVDCPKCGFNQPDDQYCAQCGVDMQNYVPKPKPLWVRVTNKPSFHIAMALLIAVGIFSWIYISQKQRIDNTIRSAFNQTAPVAENDYEEETPEPDTQAPAPRQQQEVAMAALAGSTSAQQQQRVVTPTPELPKSLRVSYAEVPRALVELWIAEGQVINETANTRSLLLNGTPDIQNFAREEWGLFKLPGGRRLSLANSSTPRRDEYLQESQDGQEIGLVIEIIPSQIGIENISFDLQMLITLPASLLGDAYATTMTGSYSFNPNSSLVILGGLPQQGIQGEQRSPFTRSPLQILTSPEYIGGTSEFAIFIQAQ